MIFDPPIPSHKKLLNKIIEGKIYNGYYFVEDNQLTVGYKKTQYKIKLHQNSPERDILANEIFSSILQQIILLKTPRRKRARSL